MVTRWWWWWWRWWWWRWWCTVIRWESLYVRWSRGLTTIIFLRTFPGGNSFQEARWSSHSQSQLCRAVASREEAQGPQHLASGQGSGWVWGIVSPPAAGWPRKFFKNFLNTKSCTSMHSLALKIGNAIVLIEAPQH